MATVIAPHAVDSDACATAMCVLGHEDGMRLAQSIPDIHVRIITRESSNDQPGGWSYRISKSPSFPKGEPVIRTQ